MAMIEVYVTAAVLETVPDRWWLRTDDDRIIYYHARVWYCKLGTRDDSSSETVPKINGIIIRDSWK